MYVSGRLALGQGDSKEAAATVKMREALAWCRPGGLKGGRGGWVQVAFRGVTGDLRGGQGREIGGEWRLSRLPACATSGWRCKGDWGCGRTRACVCEGSSRAGAGRYLGICRTSLRDSLGWSRLGDETLRGRRGERGRAFGHQGLEKRAEEGDRGA